MEEYGFELETKNKEYAELMTLQLDFINSQKEGSNKDIVVNGNLRGEGGVSWQFFKGTKVLSAIPNEEDILALQNAGYEISCIQWGDTLPLHIRTNSKIKLIRFE